MRLRSLSAIVALCTLGAPALGAQGADHGWLVGATLVAPATLLDATDGEVRSAPGLALEVSRRWRRDSELPPFLRARLARVPTEASRGVASWDPGAITSLDVIAGVGHPVGARMLAHVGLGVGLWAMPDVGAPFVTMGALRPLAEVGLHLALTPRLRASVGASGTSIPADDARAQSAGYYWRPMLGLSRAF
jgi:hypothetical protein